MHQRFMPASVRARFTLVMASVSLLAYVVIGIIVDTAVRNRVEHSAFGDTRQAAVGWIDAMRLPTPRPPIASSRVPYLQLVNSAGNVVSSSDAASSRAPMSGLWPPFEEQIQNRVECANGHCRMITASRVSTNRAIQLWEGQTHVVYAAMPRPALLDGHRLETMVGVGVLTATALTGWVTWLLIGRALRPVEVMRGQMAEITISDLTRRLPQPPGDDAIARLARTANQTLSRLEAAVARQRRFGSVVSHELRRPLTGLRTQLEEALLFPEVDPRQAVQDALATTERLQAIIEEMLTLTRVGTGPQTVEPVNLTALAREETATRPDRPPVRVHAVEEVMITGNRVQLASVLTNLLVNAQRHARTGVDVSVTRTADQARLSVQDDGVGIAPDDRERVFQPFVRLNEGRHRDPTGSGLGLALSRAVAEAHNGTLSVEDSPQGTRFVLHLPLP